MLKRGKKGNPKTAEATSDLVGNKFAYEITRNNNCVRQ